MCKCLYCYQELGEGQRDFHPKCARKFFGTSAVPHLDYTREDMDKLAEHIIQSQTTLTGVQPKISLHLNQHKGSKRLTIVGLWGGYIFKPQTDTFPYLPENEDLTMHLAEIARIKVVPHSLIRLRDGEIGYITRRIDRTHENEKIPMEDFCQLSERPTEYKYRSSYEQVAKVILKYSSIPMLDLVHFFELLLFCWLTGNNDMHLKNFSLFKPIDEDGFRLTPAYDLLNVAIANPADKEELALTLNGKKKRITATDFYTAMTASGLDAKVSQKIIQKAVRSIGQFEDIIRNSFLPTDLQEAYLALLSNRKKSITK